MNHKDIEIGMKVVPHAKSAEVVGLQNSVAWGRAKALDQPYLFVTSIGEDCSKCTLSEVMGSTLEATMGQSGDYFHSSDFEPHDPFSTMPIQSTLDEEGKFTGNFIVGRSYRLNLLTSTRNPIRYYGAVAINGQSFIVIHGDTTVSFVLTEAEVETPIYKCIYKD